MSAGSIPLPTYGYTLPQPASSCLDVRLHTGTVHTLPHTSSHMPSKHLVSASVLLSRVAANSHNALGPSSTPVRTRCEWGGDEGVPTGVPVSHRILTANGNVFDESCERQRRASLCSLEEDTPFRAHHSVCVPHEYLCDDEEPLPTEVCVASALL